MEEYNDEKQKEMRFESLKHFFVLDMEVKQKLIELNPRGKNIYDEERKIEYLDSIYNTTKEIKQEFIEIFKGLGMEKSIDALNHFFDIFNIECVYNINNPINLNEELLSKIRREFIEEVKNQTGYSYGGNLEEIISKAKTLNELLHCIHSYIVNNGEILQSMPRINNKINTKNYPITLYGEDTELARKIFEEFPLELDVNETTIVSLEDRVLMMVRGVGHELTIEVEPSVEGKCMIRYFVPKICNEEMVRNLKGINKASITKNGAVGVFETTLEDLTSELFDFISKVPDDNFLNNIKGDSIYQLNDNNTIQEYKNKTLTQKFFEWIMGTSLFNNRIIRRWVSKLVQKHLLAEGTENDLTNSDNITRKTDSIPGIKQEDGKPYLIETPLSESKKDLKEGENGEIENDEIGK